MATNFLENADAPLLTDITFATDSFSTAPHNFMYGFDAPALTSLEFPVGSLETTA